MSSPVLSACVAILTSFGDFNPQLFGHHFDCCLQIRYLV
ncbi:hypothetical protein GECvBGOT_gp161 [Salmonella phage GEC_vB_GOT]|nr:hypothetical protein GECvBGOT_gp161 [Salmonella phage GEC_vB_GOT]